jgi:Golgi phosphoprotein 3 (GPP34)
MTQNITLAEKFGLLILDNKSGTRKTDGLGYTTFYTTVSIVAELVNIQKLDFGENKISVIDNTKTNISYLDDVLEYFANTNIKNPTEAIYSYYSLELNKKGIGEENIVDEVYLALTNKNLITKQKNKFLWLIDNTKFHLSKQGSKNVNNIVEQLRVELLEDGEISDEGLMLALLLQKIGWPNQSYIKDYFSKYELESISQKLSSLPKKENMNNHQQKLTDVFVTVADEHSPKAFGMAIKSAYNFEGFGKYTTPNLLFGFVSVLYVGLGIQVLMDEKIISPLIISFLMILVCFPATKFGLRLVQDNFGMKKETILRASGIAGIILMILFFVSMSMTGFLDFLK